MSGLDLDADGFLDMDQFPDDGTDLAGPDLDQLREVLHADPVEEPTAEQWDAMFDDVVTAGDAGPFALDDVEGLTVDDADGELAGSTPDPDDVLDDDGTPDADDGFADGDGDGFADGDGDGLPDVDGVLPDDLPVDAADDLDLDGTADYDGGLDLTPDDVVDDVYTPEALDDAPAEVANNDFEDLL